MPEFVYWIRCPKCGITTILLETSLSKILQCRQVLQTGDPFLVFVCQGCKAAFRWNYPHRTTVGVIDDGQKTEEYRSQMFYSVVVRCDDNNCDSRLELVAIRPSGSNAKQWQAEMPDWKLDGIFCDNGHQILFPDHPHSDEYF